MITEASEAADQIITEANSIAEQATKEANHYAHQVQKHADEQAKIITAAAELKAKTTIKEIRESMQSLVRSYEGLLEQRDAMVKSLRRLSQDALNQIDLSDAHFARIDGKAYTRAVEELSRSSHFTVANIAALVPDVSSAVNDESEENMADATLDEETQETVTAMQHQLEDEGDLEVEVQEEEVIEEESAEEEVIEEEPATAEVPVEEEDEVEIREEVPAKVEPKAKPESPKAESPANASGSFFDQFD